MAVEDSLDIFGSDPFGRDYLYGLSTGRNGQGLAPYGTRYAESLNQPTTAKGRGYLGNVGTMQDPMTEFSSAFEVGGKTVQYPLVVPTLTADELNLLRLTGKATPQIQKKAQQFALNRLSRGLDPFATPQDLRYPQPQAVDTRPYDRMQATPRGFTSGLFSDVLSGTFNMPSMPRTGIPSLDLLYANRNPLFNLMGVGDIQKTAERISYGEPLTTGSGMTTKPREETLFAGMAVAPLAPAAGRLASRAVKATEGMPVGMSIKPINLSKGIYKPELTMEEMLKVKDIPTVERVRKSIDLVGEKEFEKMVNAQYKKYKPVDQDQEAMLVESVTLDILGRAQRSPYPQQAALDLAQQRAALPVEYPLAPAGTRYEEFGGALTYMTPDEFLQQVRPLQLDAESLDNIAALRKHVEAGGKLDPLHIYATGKEDGRHRAYLAKELGIEKVPVALHGQPITPIASPTFTDPFGNTIGSSIR